MRKGFNEIRTTEQHDPVRIRNKGKSKRNYGLGNSPAEIIEIKRRLTTRSILNSSKVRSRPDLVGETRNLKNPADQRRSQAALFAKKRDAPATDMGRYWYYAQQRELTDKEVELILKEAPWLASKGP